MPTNYCLPIPFISRSQSPNTVLIEVLIDQSHVPSCRIFGNWLDSALLLFPFVVLPFTFLQLKAILNISQLFLNCHQ